MELQNVFTALVLPIYFALYCVNKVSAIPLLDGRLTSSIAEEEKQFPTELKQAVVIPPAIQSASSEFNLTKCKDDGLHIHFDYNFNAKTPIMYFFKYLSFFYHPAIDLVARLQNNSHLSGNKDVQDFVNVLKELKNSLYGATIKSDKELAALVENIDVKIKKILDSGQKMKNLKELDSDVKLNFEFLLPLLKALMDQLPSIAT